MKFADVDAYLDFFENVLVRHSKSKYQIEIAERYCVYVRKAAEPLAVPLLIPELRYEGKAIKHKYRLDFAVIDPITMQKTGFGFRQSSISEKIPSKFDRSESV